MNFEEAFNLCDYDKKIKNDFLLFFKNNFDFNNPKINLFSTKFSKTKTKNFFRKNWKC